MRQFFFEERRVAYVSISIGKRRAAYDAKVKVLIKSAKAVILNLFG